MTLGLALFLAATVLAPASASGPASQDDRGRTLIRNVATHDRFIVFSYAGDLWRVERSGGTAEQLTRGPEEDDFPVFAPDGLSLAFSRRGADDWDVYVIGPQGGEPRRLTHHPEADIARGWTPDGQQVLFMSHRDEEFNFRLYTIPVQGAFATPLPLPRGMDGSYGPRGERIAYVPSALPLELFGSSWRHYRGGMASRILIARLSDSRTEPLPGAEGNDRDPMWLGDRIYFVSDRSGTFNIHAYLPVSRTVEQLTEYVGGYGVESAAAASDVIVFLQDGRIRTLDLATRTITTVPIEVRPDTSSLQPRTAPGASFVQSAAPSPTGDRVVLGVRGDVVMVDVAGGAFENLTASAGVAERYPAISPDGRWVAYFSDETGEYQLHVKSLEASGELRVIPVELRPSFYRELTWSPDSRNIAFSDKHLTLWVADIETRGARRITTSEYSDQDRYFPAWSPDGVWLAYSRYEPNRLRTVWLFDTDRGRRVQVTDGSVHAEHPVFDRSGRYLYFVSSATAALGEFGWSVLSGEIWQPLVSRRLQLVVLRRGVPAPIMPVTGEPNPAADTATAPSDTGPPLRGRRERQQPGERRTPPGRGRGPQVGPPTVVDPAGIEDRIVPLPLPAKDYAGLAAGEPGVLLVNVSEWPDSPQPGATPRATLYRFDLSKPKELRPLVEGFDAFTVAADGRHILYRRGREWALVSSDTAATPEAGRLNLAPLSLEIDPRAEWRQMYHEAWRLMRDYFYDPNHHGQNLAGLERDYASYLPSITNRRDLNHLIAKALGHVSVSHLGVSGGDLERPPGSSSGIGLLGADYAVSEGRYRITRIYRSGSFNSGVPLLQAPLDQPGVGVREGDYLMAVDGEEIFARRNLYAYFAGKARRPTQIRVAAQPTGEGARTYTVVPLPGENTLRRLNWAERNRRIVEQESQGILGYVYVPNFGARGLETVFEQLLPALDKRGLIIDERFNGGGITSDFLIEMLARRPLYYYMFRDGGDLGVPTNAPPRAKGLLINDANGSAAETFALMFKLANLGKIVGTRTMGAGIGPYVFMPELIDGGRVSIPNRAAFNPEGNWAIENLGIVPDIAVDWLPAEWRAGRDPQLETAIKTVLQLIVDNPPLETRRPDYPVHK